MKKIDIFSIWCVVAMCFMMGESREVVSVDTIKAASIIQKGVDDCTMNSKKGEICTLHVDDLIPSQFGIGQSEVDCKVSLLNSLSKSKMEKYLEDPSHYSQIIIAPDGYRLIDGHHLARALSDCDHSSSSKITYCYVVNNWSSNDNSKFFQTLVDQNLIWLFDEKGYAPIAPEHFPKNLKGMMNDPYRSLSWMTRRAGGWAKVGIPFEDFIWANFFRNNIPLPSNVDPIVEGQTFFSWCQVAPYTVECLDDDDKWLNSVFPKAMQFCNSTITKDLPGWGKGIVEPPNCGDS